MEQIAITEKDGANYHLYELDGALNAYTLGEFQDTLYDAVQKNNVVLDMSRLVELDASGIGLLMAAYNDSEDAGNKLYFMTMSNEADKAIAATGFKYVFNHRFDCGTLLLCGICGSFRNDGRFLVEPLPDRRCGRHLHPCYC